MILRLFEENPRLSLRGGQSPLRENGVIASCDNIRRPLLAHDVKLEKHKEKTVPVRKTCTKLLFGHRHAWSTHANRLIKRIIIHHVRIHVW